MLRGNSRAGCGLPGRYPGIVRGTGPGFSGTGRTGHVFRSRGREGYVKGIEGAIAGGVHRYV